MRAEVSRLTESLSEGEASTSSLEERTEALARLTTELSSEKEKLESELALAHSTLIGTIICKIWMRRSS